MAMKQIYRGGLILFIFLFCFTYFTGAQATDTT